MTAVVFVDTNVFVYARDESEPLKGGIANRWLEELWREHRGRTSTQVLNEYYVTVTRKLPNRVESQAAWADVSDLFSWEPQEIDCELLTAAGGVEKRFKMSWWDSMIVAAAQLQDCTVLLSEDFQDGMSFGSVAVRNPFPAGVAERGVASEHSHLRGLSVERHRRRGRPRSTSR